MFEDALSQSLGSEGAWHQETLPIVSIVVPFWGYLFRILNIILVKPKKGTTMETIGKPDCENPSPRADTGLGVAGLQPTAQPRSGAAGGGVTGFRDLWI